jgi:hypothetical protein
MKQESCAGALMGRALNCFLFLTLFAAGTFAHEMRPAYLQLHQNSDDTYDLFWKVPAVGDNMRLSLYVQMPSRCSNLTAPNGFFSAGAYTEQWSVICHGGLSGSTIRIIGLTATLTDVLVRIERIDGSSQITRLTSSAPSFVVEAAPRRFEVARTYLVLGIDHILTVSAFTLSHTVTLTLAKLGFVHVPPAPVEAVIALSILFVAYEVLRKNDSPNGLAQRKAWLVAFSFGLLHGLGFAGGLSAAGLPAGHIPLSLGFFSAGVEIGHFCFVLMALLLIAAAEKCVVRLPAWSWRIPPYAIGSVASYWLIARIAAF